MASSPPRFRYHPDPVATGSAIPSAEACSLCGQSPGLLYNGPIFGREPDVLCLDCIASGRASQELEEGDQPAEFTDVGWGVPSDVPPSVTEEVGQRTPGFRGWQQEHWLYHCGDAAAFLGRVGFDELTGFPEALDMLRHENDQFGWTAAQSDEYVRSLRQDGDATGYLFRCLHCGEHIAYSDMN